MTVSTETVGMAKSRPRKNQSERSDLPCHIIIAFISEGELVVATILKCPTKLETLKKSKKL